MVAAVALGVLENRARRQQELVSTVELLGGRVYYEFEIHDKIPTAILPNATPSTPVWLRGLLDDDYFRSVKFVYLNGTKVTDADLSILNNVRGIESISLNNTDISAKGLAHLSSQTELRFLSLSNTPIDDAAISELQNMTTLNDLRLSGTAVTASCLSTLKQNVNLTQLYVSASRISRCDTKDLRETMAGIKIVYTRN